MTKEEKVLEKRLVIYQILIILLVPILFFISSNISIQHSIKLDSFILVFGNFLIAYYITSILSKKNKNEELLVSSCFTELDYLLQLIEELRTNLNDETVTTKEVYLEDILNRYTSLLILQSALIEKYNFIDNSSNEKLKTQLVKLEVLLTAEDKPDEDYKFQLLQVERTILNIKSEILT